MPSAPSWSDIALSLGLESGNEIRSLRSILVYLGGHWSFWDHRMALLQKIAIQLGADRVQGDTEGALLRKMVVAFGGYSAWDDGVSDSLGRLYEAFGGTPPTPPDPFPDQSGKNWGDITLSWDSIQQTWSQLT